MSSRLICYTLFDITRTLVFARQRPIDLEAADYQQRRNSQTNFDTVMQVISIRSLPELESSPERISINKLLAGKFGTDYKLQKTWCWQFVFSVSDISVFQNEDSRLVNLDLDCEQVPMMHTGREIKTLSRFLDTSTRLRNIVFEVTDHEH